MASSLWTMFQWEYDVNSLSITTESMNGDSQVSGSTSVVLTHGGSPPLNWSSFAIGGSQGRLGGRQAVSTGLMLIQGARGVIETTWSDGASGSTKRSNSAFAIETFATKTKLSVQQSIPIVSARSDVNWSGGVGGPLIQQPTSYARNLTNNP